MTKLLWISHCAPYEKVAHAGGKNHLYWLNTVLDTKEFDVRLITFCNENEVEKIEVSQFECEYNLYVVGRNVLYKYGEKILSILCSPYLIYKYALALSMHRVLYVKKTIRKMKREGYCPDTIMLHWTQMGLLHKIVKKEFPNAKIVVMEEDVNFLKTERKYKNSKGISKWFNGLLHGIMVKKELEMICKVNGTIVTNKKDYDLLLEKGIKEEKIMCATSYYQQMHDVSPKLESNNILFYGAMNRKDNVECVLWFVKEVMPKLRMQGDFRFVIVGGNPTKEIKELECEYIKVTGYVEDVTPFFEDAFCLAVPLFSGAGIKIKVLEGMSAGLPVLTNEIGIEGIGAMPGKEYCHCTEKKDYLEWIVELKKCKEKAREIGEKGRSFVSKNFNPEKSKSDFCSRLK